ncbi:hypothetical protein FO440_02195 [Mucilaginibacter corticis]|uniref:Uncharacterized protein n=1 Tax=Mucilaginibacter corticis TaxID=2597670 RepID=A0A556MSX3_9SPHI|nr:hypothetical protein [Mucilaginibacter corticis]TSJ43023.1 hypothetical protein FO440_02195 [Mucilaginibacter corticis]
MLKLSYETLFEISIRHHYHLDDGAQLFDTLGADAQFALQNKYDVSDFFSITPSALTSNIFANYHAVCKATSTGLIAGMRYTQSGPLNLPEIKPDDTTVFSFYITVLDGLFANYSALPLQLPIGMVYYFTNDTAFSKRIFPFITATPAVYAGSTDYYPGDMLVDKQPTPTKLYIAQKKNSVDPALDNTGNWITDPLVNKKPLLYAGAPDMIRRMGRIFNYQVTVADKLPVLTIKDRFGNTISNLVTVIETGEFNQLKADLGALPEGLYYAHVATADNSYKDDFAFYYSQNSSAWAIIDIVTTTGNTAYNLISPDGSLVSPVFSLRFKNRATFWRYIGRSFGAASVSANSLPLTRQGFISVQVQDGSGNNTTDDLPNPSAAMIKPETNQIFSEIYM